MSLLFKYALSRFVIAFLLRSKHLLILWLQSLSKSFSWEARTEQKSSYHRWWRANGLVFTPRLPLGPKETAGGTRPFSGPRQVLASPCSSVSFINLVPWEAPPLLKSSISLHWEHLNPLLSGYLPNSESFRLGEHPRPLLKDGGPLTGVPGTLGFLDVFLLSSFLCSLQAYLFFLKPNN